MAASIAVAAGRKKHSRPAWHFNFIWPAIVICLALPTEYDARLTLELAKDERNGPKNEPDTELKPRAPAPCMDRSPREVSAAPVFFYLLSLTDASSSQAAPNKPTESSRFARNGQLRLADPLLRLVLTIIKKDIVRPNENTPIDYSCLPGTTTDGFSWSDPVCCRSPDLFFPIDAP